MNKINYYQKKIKNRNKKMIKLKLILLKNYKNNKIKIF